MALRTNEFQKIPIPADLAQRQINISENAMTVLKKRYLRRGEDGKPVETIQEMFWRVAYHVALAEQELGGDAEQVDQWARRFFDLLTNVEFFPNSPTFTGAGTPLGQLAACFVLRIEDDMGRTGSGIFETLRHAALIQQTGGGNGFAFSRLRPKGALVRSSNGTATGPLGFLRVYDQAFGEIAQGGCLVPDTLVFTERGLLRLDEIVQHDDQGWRGHELSVNTDEGMRASYQGFNNGISPVLRVQTDAGLELTGTPNHKVKVMTADGPTWRRLDALQAGDAILVKLGQHQGHPQALDVPTKQHGNQQMPHFKTVLDEELAFFIGYLMGDGFIAAHDNDHRVGVSVAHSSYLMKAMPAILEELFGITVHEQQKANDASVTFVMNNRAVKDYLLINGFEKAKSAYVRVPRRIRQSPPAVVGAFLRGLFEADGSLSHGYPQLLSTSETLVREVATLLIGLGCPVNIGQMAGNWSVQPTEPTRFQEAIARRHHLHQMALANAAPTQDYADSPAIDDLWFVAVQTVEAAGEALTLDIEVEDNHTYLANGMVTHNSRRGANMAVLRVDHPDIRDFIKSKSEEGTIANFNISVGISDEFMQAVERGTTFDLRFNDRVYETVDARELFDMIVQYAHHNGEPGVLFLDAANRENPVPHLYVLESTNPCGEQYLGPFENCCLGSVNLASHVTDDGQVLWDKLADSVATATRFLDDVVTANAYVPAIPQLREAAENVRRIGLGIMGLADMMYAMGVRYGSPEGQEFASQVMEFVRYHSMKTSIDLAEERGPFLAIEGSRYDPNNLKWTAPKSLVRHKTDWQRPAIDWKGIEKGLKAHGIRNGAQTTIAPTGTLSTVAGCEGYGCEPVFALAYVRYVNTNAGNSEERFTLQYTSPHFERALRQANLDQATIDRIVEQVNMTGSCQAVSEVPDHIRHVFVTANDITAEEHIRMQAVMQAHIDNSISKTCNFPSEATEDDVAQAYMLGWKLGCKGLTVYVTGSREKVVLETAATREKREGTSTEAPAESKKSEQMPLFNEKKKPRPGLLPGRTYRLPTPVGTTYVTINENGYGQGQPFEVFVHTAKAGSETAAVSEALGRLMSLILRQASPVSPRDRVKEMTRQMLGIGGGRQTGFGPNRVASLPDGIAQVLQQYLVDSSLDENEDDLPDPQNQLGLFDAKPASNENGGGHGYVVGDLCPECGDATLVREEGCLHCYSCGYSEC
ncbi:MAG: adenosylcobalamin-dependent ribonucleoside-diphosphate reductase [Anaerolineales bacterium]|nr:adenosylcobalamin-dependent ribonucleoside-diphosphate reductase [Anaerolineales bacterium]